MRLLKNFNHFDYSLRVNKKNILSDYSSFLSRLEPEPFLPTSFRDPHMLLLPSNANSAQFLEAILFLLFTGLFLEGKDVTKP